MTCLKRNLNNENSVYQNELLVFYTTDFGCWSMQEDLLLVIDEIVMEKKKTVTDVVIRCLRKKNELNLFTFSKHFVFHFVLVQYKNSRLWLYFEILNDFHLYLFYFKILNDFHLYLLNRLYNHISKWAKCNHTLWLYFSFTQFYSPHETTFQAFYIHLIPHYNIIIT